ncbi:membrane-associating domain-containing protein [Xylariaceae sp. AK1471]|nr:membrane-associating domain-containing protein [Xylariaceae sp. AK1471]
MILTDLVSVILRIAELVFAAIVAGINGEYLHLVRHSSSWDQGRFIYTEVVAGIAIFLSLIWLFPFSSSFIHWPVDFLISVTWFVAFGLLVNYFGGSCGYVFDWDNVSIRGDQCGKWKAVIAFAFLSAICWLVSGIVGIIWVRDRESRAYHRRTWRNRSRV